MSALSQQQVADCAAKVAAHLFQGVAAAIGGTANTTATVNWTDLENAVSALDAAFDEVISNIAVGTSSDTIIQFLASKIPAPASGGTVQQKTILACYVLLKRAGLI